MLYNVIDLNSGETIASGTCQQIAHWWRRKFKDQKGNVNFRDLNVTGKDVVICKEKDGFSLVMIDGKLTLITNWVRVRYLRRYQVLDEDGRSVDIRNWSKDVWEYKPPRHRPLVLDWVDGSKSHFHRTSGPSMWRGTFSSSMETADETELLEDGLPLPIQSNVDVRLPFNTSTVWDYYDRHHFHRKSKSWKDQSKARKQWGKCKRSGKSQRREDDWARLDPDWVIAEDENSAANGEMKEAA